MIINYETLGNDKRKEEIMKKPIMVLLLSMIMRKT